MTKSRKWTCLNSSFNVKNWSAPSLTTTLPGSMIISCWTFAKWAKRWRKIGARSLRKPCRKMIIMIYWSKEYFNGETCRHWIRPLIRRSKRFCGHFLTKIETVRKPDTFRSNNLLKPGQTWLNLNLKRLGSIPNSTTICVQSNKCMNFSPWG